MLHCLCFLWGATEKLKSLFDDRYQSIRRTITNSDRSEESSVDLVPEPESELMPHSISG